MTPLSKIYYLREVDLLRIAVGAYLACLALLPWSSVPPFPWLHAHAQWSDVAFALAAVAWLIASWRSRDWPRIRPFHAAMAVYVLAATLSFAFADARHPSAPPKLLGMAALVALAGVTADLASRGALRLMARVVAVTSLAASIAAAAGVFFFFMGYPTRLIGTYGELVPGAYARAQAGLYHPNLFASYCIFAAAVVAHPGAELPPRFRRIVLASLSVAVLLTFSRGILAFMLSAAVRGASTPARRGLAAAYGVVAVGIIAGTSVLNLSLDPTRPHRVRLEPGPSSRLEEAATAWDALLARPLWGSGPGSSAANLRGFPFDAHCTVLNIGATLGLPALAAFVAIPLFLWRGRSRPTDRATWGALAGVGLESLAQDVEDFRHVWILFGLAATWRPAEPVRPDQRFACAS